jgi:predicted site-specific integrase-resolvase
MSYSSYTARLETLEKYIKRGWIKTPKDIVKRLHVSERTALRPISSLKENGTIVKYSRKDKAYKIILSKK